MPKGANIMRFYRILFKPLNQINRTVIWDFCQYLSNLYCNNIITLFPTIFAVPFATPCYLYDYINIKFIPPTLYTLNGIHSFFTCSKSFTIQTSFTVL